MLNVAHRIFDPSLSPGDHASVNPTLMELIRDVSTKEMMTVDVGCGMGGLTFEAANYLRHVVGIDISAEPIESAKKIASDRGICNVSFTLADAETIDYKDVVEGRKVDMVIANLCMSDDIIKKAHEALDRGRYLIFAALELEQWKETGRPSRFAYSKEGIKSILESRAFDTEHISIEREIIDFKRREDIDVYFEGSTLKKRWQKDGRWDGLLQYLNAGGLKFTTKSRLIVKGRKVS